MYKRYQALSKEEKKRKKPQYGHEYHKNISKNEKEKLGEYRKFQYKIRENIVLNSNDLETSFDEKQMF